MHRRAALKLSPGLERLEAKQMLSGGALPRVGSDHAASEAARVASTADSVKTTINPAALPKKFLGFRITNPKIPQVNLIPPFGQVLVQSQKPVPGQVYNIMYVAVKNGTGQTFTSSSAFVVRFPNKKGAHEFPILTGGATWKPQQWIVFYVMTKQYYPLTQIQGGFQFDLGGRSTTLVPGPSAIYQKLIYNPANFAKKLNSIVAYGQGAQLGVGPPTGMVDTAINTFVGGKTHRIDYGGHF